ncbi:MAG: TerC/Alx family metal homeostasis membrane protein [Puia sp.]|nr:TerC/Alx family metal homeostasis membrane protein [Puia sp.]
MNHSQLAYLIFGIVLLLAITFDLGLVSRKGQTITIRKALFQTAFWVVLALGFFVFLWYGNGQKTALEYLSAYLMEWSLSIDNIFVFILIFSFFKVREKDYGRVLLIGILIAILLRILFISLGIALIARFHWLLYVFGGILIYTGISMFRAKKNEEGSLADNPVYKLLRRVLPLTLEEGGGRFSLVRDGKKVYTSLFVVVILLATTDVVFALDSIPAVFGITQVSLVVYTSNIFAVLGLRSLFFLLRGAVDKFSHLQQGIAVVLVFIGLKMLAEIAGIYLSVFVSLGMILLCISVAIAYSLYSNRRIVRETKRPGPTQNIMENGSAETGPSETGPSEIGSPGKNLSENSLSDGSLPGSGLPGTDLPGTDLSGIDLPGTAPSKNDPSKNDAPKNGA